jgi:hypothetical protein
MVRKKRSWALYEGIGSGREAIRLEWTKSIGKRNSRGLAWSNKVGREAGRG